MSQFTNRREVECDPTELYDKGYQITFQPRYHMPEVYILRCLDEYIGGYNSEQEATNAAWAHMMRAGATSRLSRSRQKRRQSREPA